MEALPAPPTEPEPEAQPEAVSDASPGPSLKAEPEMRSASLHAPKPEVIPAPEPVTPTGAQPKKEGSCLSALQMVLRVTVRVLVAIIFGVMLGVLLYVGVPWLQNRFVVPLDQHEQRLDILETDVARRLEGLESERQAQAEQVGEVHARLDSLDQSLDTRLATQTALQAQVMNDADALRTTLAEIEQQIAVLESRAEELQAALDAQRERLDQSQAVDEEQAAALTDLEQQTQLLRAMGMLSRARLFLMQNNLGLAQLDIEAARATLAVLRPDLDEPETQALEAILLRLDLALDHLYTAPVLVVDDLEVAWQLLRRGLEPLDNPQMPVLATLTPELMAPQVVSPTLTLEAVTLTPTP